MATMCKRCSLREVDSELKQICSICILKMRLDKQSQVSDDEILSHHVLKRVQEGCRECKSKAFAYEAGVKQENGLKWFIILVDCGACGKAYEEIMEIRIDTNEPNKYEESE